MAVSSDDRTSPVTQPPTAPPPSPLPSLDPANTTPGEDWVTLLLAAWLLGGLFLDGYAHAYVIDTATEDFFTPWHGVFYAGFAALAAWVAVVGYRRRRPGPLVEWFPPSYRLAVVGLALFALGGVGDGIWHTVYGVEIGIDALLSPTHLLLLAGGLLLIWTPVRSSAARGDEAPWLAVGSATIITAVLVFFVQYLWLIPYPFYAQQTFVPTTGVGSSFVQLFLGAAIVSVGVLAGPLLLVAKRWVLPFGAATIVWGVAATLEALAFSQRFTTIVVVGIGGLVFDGTLRVVGAARARGLRAAAGAGPAAMFVGYLVWAASEESLAWPPEIWGGLCVTAGFVGIGLAMLQENRPRPEVR